MSLLDHRIRGRNQKPVRVAEGGKAEVGNGNAEEDEAEHDALLPCGAVTDDSGYRRIGEEPVPTGSGKRAATLEPSHHADAAAHSTNTRDVEGEHPAAVAGCWPAMRRGWSTAGHFIYRVTIGHLPGFRSRSGHQSPQLAGRDDSQRSVVNSTLGSTGGAGAEGARDSIPAIYHPGEGYEVVTTRQSICDNRPEGLATRRETTPIPQQPQLTSSSEILPEGSSGQKAGPLPAEQQQGPRKGRRSGKEPLIATTAQREALMDKAAAKALTQHQATTGASATAMLHLRAKLADLAKACPIGVAVDFVGRSVSITLTGPITLLPDPKGEPSDDFDVAPLEAIEELLFSTCTTVSSKPEDLQLHSLKVFDIDFTPPVAAGFSRPPSWNSQGALTLTEEAKEVPAPGQAPSNSALTPLPDGAVPMEDPEVVEGRIDKLKRRQETVRVKTVALINILLSEAKTLCNLTLTRCMMTPADITSKIHFPEDGHLESLVIKDCNLSDPHLSGLLRLGQRSLTNRKKSAPSEQFDSDPGSVHLQTFFGGLIKLELGGSFSQATVAVFLRFLRDEQLVEISEDHHQLSPSKTGSPLRTTALPSSARSSFGRDPSSSSSGVRYGGMKLQQLTFPAQLSSFIRHSEFAKRLPLLLVNGRGVNIPVSRFGSSADLVPRTDSHGDLMLEGAAPGSESARF
jgi:hypothetical protein